MAQHMNYQYQEEQRPGSRPRSRSAFSILSQKSDKSSGSKQKFDFSETASQKERRRYQVFTSSNPNRAISEAQPSVRAQDETATLQPLRSMQYMDWKTGSVITDPDASNPSRSRLERPLDTIRSFEAAADSGYSNRNPPARIDAIPTQSRRSSTFLGYEGFPSPKGSQVNGYHENFRRSVHMMANQEYNRGPPNSYPRRGMGPRISSAPAYNRAQHDRHLNYSNHNYHDAYDVGESSGSQSDPWTNSTNPSSENSSVDRINAYKQGDASGDAYGGQYGRRSASPFHYPIAEQSRQQYHPRRNSGGRELYYPENRRYSGGRDLYYSDNNPSQNLAPQYNFAPQNNGPQNNLAPADSTESNGISSLRQAQANLRAPPQPVAQQIPQPVAQQIPQQVPQHAHQPPPRQIPQRSYQPTPQQIRQNGGSQKWPMTNTSIDQQRPDLRARQASQLKQGDPKRQRLEKPLPKSPAVAEKKKSWLARRFSK